MNRLQKVSDFLAEVMTVFSPLLMPLPSVAFVYELLAPRAGRVPAGLGAFAFECVGFSAWHYATTLKKKESKKIAFWLAVSYTVVATIFVGYAERNVLFAMLPFFCIIPPILHGLKINESVDIIDVAALQSTIATLQTELQQMKDGRADMQSKYDRMQTDLREAQSREATMKKDNDKLAHDLRVTQGNLKTLQDNAKDALADGKALRAVQKELQDSRDTLQMVATLRNATTANDQVAAIKLLCPSMSNTTIAKVLGVSDATVSRAAKKQVGQ